MNFSKIIDSIENELSGLYLGGAIAYVDEHFDNAWSKAIDRFDTALSNALATQNFAAIEIEGEIYKATILRLMDLYKTQKRSEKIKDDFFGVKGEQMHIQFE